MPSNPTFQLKQRFPNLRELGIELEHFPRYVNTRPQMHALDVVLMTIIIKGRGHHIMEDSEYAENGCSVGITHFGQGHSLVTGPEGMEVMNLYLDPEVCPLPDLPEPLRSALPSFLPLHPAGAHRLNRIVRIPVAKPEPFLRIVMALHRELRERKAGYAEAARSCWRLLLIELCRMALDTGARPSSPSLPSPSDAAMEQLRQFLERTWDRTHTLASLAKRAGVRPTYLCRIFKRYTGRSVFDYLLDRRIRAAMMRLRTGDDKILAVALDCGFSDPSFFNRKFRQATGMAPGRYRTAVHRS